MAATVVSVIALPPSSDTKRDVLEFLVVLSEPDSVNGARIAKTASGIPADGAALGSTGLVVVNKSADPESGDGSGMPGGSA